MTQLSPSSASPQPGHPSVLINDTRNSTPVKLAKSHPTQQQFWDFEKLAQSQGQYIAVGALTHPAFTGDPMGYQGKRMPQSATPWPAYNGLSAPDFPVETPAATAPVAAPSTSGDSKLDQFFKTKMCIPFTRGQCKRGDNCCFAHGQEELQGRLNLQKTKLCEMWLKGGCTDIYCTFAHGSTELKATGDYYKTGLCKFWKKGMNCEAGEACRHAHGHQELRPRGYRRTERDKRELQPSTAKGSSVQSNLSRSSSQHSLVTLGQPVTELANGNSEMRNLYPQQIQDLYVTGGVEGELGAQVVRQASLSPYGTAIPLGPNNEVDSVTIGKSVLDMNRLNMNAPDVHRISTTASAIQRAFDDAAGFRGMDNALVAASRRKFYMSNDSIISLDDELYQVPAGVNNELNPGLLSAFGADFAFTQQDNVPKEFKKGAFSARNDTRTPDASKGSSGGVSRETSRGNMDAGLSLVNSQTTLGLSEWEMASGIRGVPSAPCVMTHAYGGSLSKHWTGSAVTLLEGNTLFEHEETEEFTETPQLPQGAKSAVRIVTFNGSVPEGYSREDLIPLVIDGRSFLAWAFVNDVLLSKALQLDITKTIPKPATLAASPLSRALSPSATPVIAPPPPPPKEPSPAELTSLINKFLQCTKSSPVEQPVNPMKSEAELMQLARQVFSVGKHASTTDPSVLSNWARKVIQESAQGHPDSDNFIRHFDADSVLAQLALQDQAVGLGFNGSDNPLMDSRFTPTPPNGSPNLPNRNKINSSSASLLFGNPVMQGSQYQPPGPPLRGGYASVPNLNLAPEF